MIKVIIDATIKKNIKPTTTSTAPEVLGRRIFIIPKIKNNPILPQLA